MKLNGKIPSITNLATTTALTAIEKQMPNVSNLVKKTDYNIKISEIANKINDYDYNKYITTPKFSKLTAENLASRLAQANLASKSDIASFLNKTDFDDKLKNSNKKVTSNKTKQDKTPFTPNNVVNLFIVYVPDRWSQDLNTKFTPKDCLF